jgi:hypothetical protein
MPVENIPFKDQSAIKDQFSVKDPHGLPFHPLPISLLAPPRRPIEQVPGGRRPVVAMLDTGVAADHTWFQAPNPDDPILISANDVTGTNWHGTFVAGLIRQNAPEARVLSFALERTEDGRIASGQLSVGLTWLQSYAAEFVDVICLAVGFRMTADDEAYVRELEHLIGELGNRGTLVVAAAGNIKDGATGPVYPAKLAATTGEPPLIAVGAVDPEGKIPDFSVQGDWVTRTYLGVDVVSTTPAIDASAATADDSIVDLASSVDPGSYPLDPSQHGWRFGRGSGTSYAAAGFAGRVAQAMLDNSEGVADVSPEAASARVRQALAAVSRPA